jgi:hypothetical protein
MGVTNPRQFDYLHVTPGRVRVKSSVLKHDPARARRVEIDLASLPGVTLARVNPTTGSILLHFDRQWTADALLALLRQRDYLVPRTTRRPASRSYGLGRDVVTECCALIGKELLGAAITRIFPNPLVTTLLAVV